MIFGLAVVYTHQLMREFYSSSIQSLFLRFRILHFRTRELNLEVLSYIHASSCKRQNETDAKMFLTLTRPHASLSILLILRREAPSFKQRGLGTR